MLEVHKVIFRDIFSLRSGISNRKEVNPSEYLIFKMCDADIMASCLLHSPSPHPVSAKMGINKSVPTSEHLPSVLVCRLLFS